MHIVLNCCWVHLKYSLILFSLAMEASLHFTWLMLDGLLRTYAHMHVHLVSKNIAWFLKAQLVKAINLCN